VPLTLVVGCPAHAQDSLSSEQLDTLKASMDTGSQQPDPNIPSWRRPSSVAAPGPVGPSGRAMPAPAGTPDIPSIPSAYPASPRELPQQAIKQQARRAATRCGYGGAWLDPLHALGTRPRLLHAVGTPSTRAITAMQQH
jgi:hypothetical protein